MHQTSDPNQLLTIRDVMARTGLSESTIERAIRAGSLRVFRLGRSVRIDERDYLAWLQANRVSTHAPHSSSNAA